MKKGQIVKILRTSAGTKCNADGVELMSGYYGEYIGQDGDKLVIKWGDIYYACPPSYVEAVLPYTIEVRYLSSKPSNRYNYQVDKSAGLVVGDLIKINDTSFAEVMEIDTKCEGVLAKTGVVYKEGSTF